jgi:hypothetical protein
MQLKKNRITPFSIVLVCMLSVSCSTERRKAAGFYNMDSLVATQVDYLIAHNVTVNKKAALNNVEKITRTVPKSILDWQNELAIFSELDVINKPINKGAYKIGNYADNKSNLKVKSFETTENLPVKYLKVYYQQSLNKVRKIEAHYNESNSLYKSARLLTMQFEDIFDKTVLTSYSIIGGQKMFLDDSVQYNIDVSLILKN